MSDSPKTELLDVSKLTGDGLDVTLVVTVPGGLQKRYPMRAPEMRAGRSDQVDITIKDASVSSRHCDFVKEGGRLIVRDIGSSNGTWLHDQRITEIELQDGDVLRLGSAATVTVEIAGGAAGARPQPMHVPEDEGGSSTMMISAGDLSAMRAGALSPPPSPAPAPPRPQRRPAPMPEPEPEYMPPPRRAAPQPMMVPHDGGDGGRSKAVLIAVAVALAVVLVGGLAVWGVMRSKARAADRESIAQIEKTVAALVAVKPCDAVQESVKEIIEFERTEGVVQPLLPVRASLRRDYAKFVNVQRDKARKYRALANKVEQGAVEEETSLDTVKTLVSRLNNADLRPTANALIEAIEARVIAGKSFATGWKTLQVETDRLADLAEAVFVKNIVAERATYENFSFSKQAPLIVNVCRRDDNESRMLITERLEALKIAAR